MRSTTLWRLAQAAALAVVVAAALTIDGQPYPDYCKWCESGELPWWLCVLNGCW